MIIEKKAGKAIVRLDLNADETRIFADVFEVASVAAFNKHPKLIGCFQWISTMSDRLRDQSATIDALNGTEASK